MKAASISTKLVALAFAGLAASIASLGWLAVTRGTRALLEQQTGALEAVRRSRRSYIESYFDIIREQIFNFAQDEMIVQATAAPSAAFEQAPSELQRTESNDDEASRELAAYYEVARVRQLVSTCRAEPGAGA